ncbi:hypothetical protein ACWFR5_23095 [Streptomyces sp. NPDC055092]
MTYLEPSPSFDAVVSVFGAVWFTDPPVFWSLAHCGRGKLNRSSASSIPSGWQPTASSTTTFGTCLPPQRP